MGDIVDERGNYMPVPGNGRAKRARIDREGNFVAGGKIYAYKDDGTRLNLVDAIVDSGIPNDLTVNSVTATTFVTGATLNGTTVNATNVNATGTVDGNAVTANQLVANNTSDQLLLEDSANGDKQYKVEIENEILKIVETGIGTPLRIDTNSVFQFGNSSTGHAIVDTNGIYRLGSMSIVNRTLNVNSTGVKTITFTFDLLTNFSGTHTCGYFKVCASACQANGGLIGSVTDETSARKIVNISSAWVAENIVTDGTVANAPVVAVDTVTLLTNQYVFTITTPNITVAPYYIAVNAEITAPFVVTAMNTVVT